MKESSRGRAAPKHVILFLAANPSDTDRLALDREARAIHVELKRSGYRDRFDFVSRWAAEPLELLRELRELKPTIVHFSGHGARPAASIVEIRKSKRDPDFPGFLKLQMSLDQIDGLYASWTQVLRNARGVYLLVRRRTGDQYVGSATGSDGFFGRWLCYQDGHGGNVGMRELGATAAEYDVNILEVAASNATVEEIYDRESLWKIKLGTRAMGLNRN